ncbi:hypothetical protein HB774_34640 (plasmid) [Rhizobium leguminosarum bv. viciae]|nr:hypothetical protein HB774_34640 [Rhizobium leguminosarum bv. viciae]
MALLSLEILPNGDPQKTRTSWSKEYSSTDRINVGYAVSFSDGDGSQFGITQTMAIDKIPTLYYDSEQQQISVADLANFIWTTVVAQSAGSHGHLVNTYDITRFTFRYYQLAVHMPNDNLIFLIRKLLALPNASNYFPYLALKSGRVHLVGPGGKQVSLETVTTVTRPNGKVEDQIVGFMSYLNPDTHNVGEIEVLNTARLMHWLLSDAEAVKASVATALEIMKRKLKRAAKTYGRRERVPNWPSGSPISSIKAVAQARPSSRRSPSQISTARCRHCP